AVEVVARRVEDEEVDAGRWASAPPVARRLRAPGERVVEGVEVRAERNRGAGFVDGAVGADVPLLEARARLDRRAVADRAEAVVGALDLPLGGDVTRRLRHRLSVRPHAV